MLKKAILLILANIAFVTAVIAVYAVGYEYDKAHQLAPESKWISYDMSLQVYGERWGRMVKFMFAVGVVANVAVFLVWYRNWQSKHKHGLGLEIDS